ncbi:MAG: hypothetical protein Ta2F_04040 [Termitinemataceae bacterium]|nr:MAG: hypothetical protein Ta2F_04040 [Termitinemataceae bacterium]
MFKIMRQIKTKFNSVHVHSMRLAGAILAASGFLLLPIFISHSQDSAAVNLGTDLNSLRAGELFRVGLEAYNRYSFNESILAFEQALSFKPEEGLILDWLGRAYYRSGLESTALRQWQAASEAYGNETPEYVQIRSRIEVVNARRSLFKMMNEESRYVGIGSFPGTTSDEIFRFSQPSAVLPIEDGSFWAVCYGSNEIVRIDVNGIVRARERGRPLEGFDRPYDIVRSQDGRIYVSEFRAGRVSMLNAEGQWLAHIGSKGIGDGQMVGAANITFDDEGYLYVVEFGNQRVSKFDPDGNFIYNFGKKSDNFAGFLSPTGIAAKGGVVYVADSIAKTIYMFDSNGMYLGVFVNQGISAPESINFSDDNELLVSDTKRLLLINKDSTVVQELSRSSNTRLRYLDAKIDYNGNILTADFNDNEISVMASLDDVASGFFVQIDRVISNDFPLVTVELTVQNNQRRSISGLDASNFHLSENGQPVFNQQFLGSESAQIADISVLIERSLTAEGLQADIADALRDINAAMDGNISSVVSAAEKPSFERFNTASSGSMNAAARGENPLWTDRWRFDLGVRLAATNLLPLSKKRAVVFVSSGTVGDLAFEQYSLSELARYLSNNGIVFYTVLVGLAPASDEIEYLCRETGGEVIPLYRQEGIAPILQTINSRSSGSYILSYQAVLSTDFGKAFLPVEAEVHLLDRSGRDAVGYFSPLH